MIKKAMLCLVVLAAIITGVKILWFGNNNQHTSEVQTEVDCNTLKQTQFEAHLKKVYTRSGLDSAGLPYHVYRKGMVGYYNLEKDTNVNKPVLSIVDFSKPSTEKRLWIFDIKEHKLLYHSLVAHGRNTGENTAEDFSNIANSNKSSIGFYLTQNTYQGKHGLSLIIDGMEKGWNDNARARSIVVHGADYVSEDFVEDIGRLGRSQGCPAVPEAICTGVVCTICDRSVMFIYYPDEKYLSQSQYLKEDNSVDAYAMNTFFSCKPYTALVLQ